MKFKKGDRVLFVSYKGKAKGVIFEKLENDLYRVHRSPYKTDDYYIRHHRRIELDKQWYRNLKIDEVLNGSI